MRLLSIVADGARSSLVDALRSAGTGPPNRRQALDSSYRAASRHQVEEFRAGRPPLAPLTREAAARAGDFFAALIRAPNVPMVTSPAANTNSCSSKTPSSTLSDQSPSRPGVIKISEISPAEARRNPGMLRRGTVRVEPVESSATITSRRPSYFAARIFVAVRSRTIEDLVAARNSLTEFKTWPDFFFVTLIRLGPLSKVARVLRGCRPPWPAQLSALAP